MLFELGVHVSILANLIQLSPETYTQSIDEHVKGVRMQGFTKTVAESMVRSYPETRGAGIAVTVDSQTEASTLNRFLPRNDILLSFRWTIDTAARTTKWAYLDESGIQITSAQSTAQSRLTLHGLEAYASGLLRRLKSRVAYEQAMAELMRTRADTERQASLRIGAELNRKVDEKVFELLQPLNQKYLLKVHKPLIREGLLGGRLRFQSTEDRFLVAGVARDQKYEVPQFTGLNWGQPVRLRVHEDWFEHLLARPFSNAWFSDEDLVQTLEASIRHPGEDRPEDIDRILPKPEEVLMTFKRGQPIGVSFSDGGILTLSLNCAFLESLGRSAADVTISRTMRIGRSPEGFITLDLGLSQSIDATELPEELRAHVDKRMQRLFALASQRIAVGLKELSSTVLLRDKLPLMVGETGTAERYLSISLRRPGKGEQQ